MVEPLDLDVVRGMVEPLYAGAKEYGFSVDDESLYDDNTLVGSILYDGDDNSRKGLSIEYSLKVVPDEDISDGEKSDYISINFDASLNGKLDYEIPLCTELIDFNEISYATEGIESRTTKQILPALKFIFGLNTFTPLFMAGPDKSDIGILKWSRAKWRTQMYDLEDGKAKDFEFPEVDSTSTESMLVELFDVDVKQLPDYILDTHPSTLGRYRGTRSS